MPYRHVYHQFSKSTCVIPSSACISPIFTSTCIYPPEYAICLYISNFSSPLVYTLPSPLSACISPIQVHTCICMSPTFHVHMCIPSRVSYLHIYHHFFTSTCVIPGRGSGPGEVAITTRAQLPRVKPLPLRLFSHWSASLEYALQSPAGIMASICILSLARIASIWIFLGRYSIDRYIVLGKHSIDMYIVLGRYICKSLYNCMGYL